MLEARRQRILIQLDALELLLLDKNFGRGHLLR